jgi:coenzyme F420-reducing hydrogenase delta subunit
MVPTSAVRQRPSPLGVAWPFHVNEVMVPCTGKLQPEHLLKAFEAGADVVCVVACAEDNCHYLQGCRRVKRRVEYVRHLLDQVGLGGERLLLFRLPGSAREDMALGCGHGAQTDVAQEQRLREPLRTICDEMAGRLRALGLSPLHQEGA